MNLRLVFTSLAWVCSFAAIPASNAQTTVRIEEDWELHVTQPDEQLDAPQITTTMIPFGDVSDLLFQVDLNHASLPSFSRGGYQVRICDEDASISTVRHSAGIVLSQPLETITWTQVVQKVSNGFYFGVTNGSSVSLGAFGGDPSFTFISNADAGTVSLDGYETQDSLENSGVTYAGNRVAWLRLKKVRLNTSSGQVTEITLNTDIE